MMRGYPWCLALARLTPEQRQVLHTSVSLGRERNLGSDRGAQRAETGDYHLSLPTLGGGRDIPIPAAGNQQARLALLWTLTLAPEPRCLSHCVPMTWHKSNAPPSTGETPARHIMEDPSAPPEAYEATKGSITPAQVWGLQYTFRKNNSGILIIDLVFQNLRSCKFVRYGNIGIHKNSKTHITEDCMKPRPTFRS